VRVLLRLDLQGLRLTLGFAVADVVRLVRTLPRKVDQERFVRRCHRSSLDKKAAVLFDEETRSSIAVKQITASWKFLPFS